MKTIKFNNLEKQDLLNKKEPICIEHNSKQIGYYYPITEYKDIKEAKEELDVIMEKVLTETELTEEEYVSMFMSTVEESCV
ncbi:hypothetical protein VB715_06710 [Crocosphaera sp. UHCC 0190]|uniref:hypothetical protein n=1 Tax=Crocosphaera sp. UHCC 0190 TaxID=3110246 RepID=UPI002B1FDA00|nr:hypothetical protein [Crocosphaera sp. UHCC 0190]MEA5509450.1 hypothetical protein [Crocosphaera sp. UHCC 0190]